MVRNGLAITRLGLLILCAAALISPVRAAPAAPAAAPPAAAAGSDLSFCSCYCACVADPTQRSCNGWGHCCLRGRRAVWTEPVGCFCNACFIFFSGQGAAPLAGCAAPDRRVVDGHLSSLFGEAARRL